MKYELTFQHSGGDRKVIIKKADSSYEAIKSARKQFGLKWKLAKCIKIG